MSQLSSSATRDELAEKSTLELAQLLAEKCAIAPKEWHRLKGDRKAQANQHITAALVYLQSSQTEQALEHLHQAIGWLDRSISVPPCPTHGHH